ncbi:RsbR, positive regulator of sigma-B [Labilithrix luteola]|uniref:RsbR, positive regulator of sigma-B n=1 Tax=Labilithrix luteola TaxID=1391654 RepID=A0A0K1QDY7_9BACT|nr:STAS domain-containing protein [Labilithrix luteola]AKV03986.1 RsbR, positive regulator of sigma-B [Labilithrix luteola]
MNDSTELFAVQSDLARCVEELERERAARRAAEGLAEEVSLAHATVLDGLEAAKEEILAAKREIMRLSNLVFPIWPSVLLMPVIGRLDVERSDLLCQTVVEEAARTRARVVILDVSGVPAVDQDIAYTLRRFDETLHIIGSQMVLCGVRPELAQMAMGGEHDTVSAVLRMPVRRTLSEALRWAIKATRT